MDVMGRSYMLITYGIFILSQYITIKMFFSISDHVGYTYATPIFIDQL